MNEIPPRPWLDFESADYGELVETLDAYTKLINQPHVAADHGAVEFLGAQMKRINIEIQARKFSQQLHDGQGEDSAL